MEDKCKHCGAKTSKFIYYINHNNISYTAIVCQKCYDQYGYDSKLCNCNQCRKRNKDEKKKKDVLFQLLQTGITSYIKGSKVIDEQTYKKRKEGSGSYGVNCTCSYCEEVREYERSLKVTSPKIIDTNGYIVISRMQGPSPMPAVHKTFESACKEAARLAKLAPEDSFVVYQPVVVVSATKPKPVEPKVNYRMCTPGGTEGLKGEKSKVAFYGADNSTDTGIGCTELEVPKDILAWIFNCI